MVEYFHYTDAVALQGIVENGELWATHFSYLNDNAELRYAFEELAKSARFELRTAFVAAAQPLVESNSKEIGWQKIYQGWVEYSIQELRKRYSQVPTYVLSTSLHEDGTDAATNGLLSQWRAYAISGGYCAVFDDHFQLQSLEGSVVRKPVHYGPLAAADLGEFIASFTDACCKFLVKQGPEVDGAKSEFETKLDACAANLFEVIAFTKHPAFQEEKEFRFAVHDLNSAIKPKFRQKAGNTLVPYAPLRFDQKAMRRIIVGPGPDTDRRSHSVKMLLRANGLHDVRVVESDIPLA